MSDTHRIAYVPPKPVVEHDCEPKDQDLPLGSVVQCNICKQYWYSDQTGFQYRGVDGRRYWRDVVRWTRVTKWDWPIWWRISKGLA